ncbi:MAG: tRNA preQ1(34) S-adenosylmethionine ribosyltransferase-isomerase QueA [Candidatus Magasanikbacteria bacterium]
MLTSEFNYHLPQERIAQFSVDPKDMSKLMVLDRKKKTREDKHFCDILDYLKKGDLLVWNNSKVFKARLFGNLEVKEEPNRRSIQNTEVEIFLVRPMENTGVWKVLGKPGKRIKNGMRIQFAQDFFCDVVVKEPEGTILVQFPYDANVVMEKANQYGHIPIPPYVKDEPHQLDMYQTAYAKHEGSVAAPTAGFHFTEGLIQQLKEKGVEFAEVTLHVGLGTFLPVKAENVEDHTMHPEWVHLTKENADKINTAKEEGRRVIAVGTTTVRTLEGIAKLAGYHDKKFEEFEGDLNIFITPGFEFQVIDAMITNFHLPKSTLLMLVASFAGNTAFMLESYKEAVEKEYRFYSFGDAMFIQ